MRSLGEINVNGNDKWGGSNLSSQTCSTPLMYQYSIQFQISEHKPLAPVRGMFKNVANANINTRQ